MLPWSIPDGLEGHATLISRSTLAVKALSKKNMRTCLPYPTISNFKLQMINPEQRYRPPQ